MSILRGVDGANEVEIDKVKTWKKNHEVGVNEVEIRKASKSYRYFTNF